MRLLIEKASADDKRSTQMQNASILSNKLLFVMRQYLETPPSSQEQKHLNKFA